MKILYSTLLFAFLISQSVVGQKSEYLIYNSDTIRLIIHEQDKLTEGTDHQSPTNSDGDENEVVQINYWEIINDSLFEVRLYNTEMSFRIFQHNTKRTLYCPAGEHIGDFGLTKVYTKEKGLLIKNGILIDIKTYDNSLSKLSLYSEKDTTFYKYLNANIDFSKMNVGNCTKVYFKIKDIDFEGVIKDLELLRGCNENTNQELMRVLKKIPNWSIIFLHGHQTDFRKVILIDLEKIKSTTGINEQKKI